MSGPVRALIVRDDADRLVIRPSDEDVSRYVLRPRLRVHVGVPPATYGSVRVTPGGFLYNGNGDAVMVVTQVRAEVETIDMTTFGSSYREFLRGMVHVFYAGKAYAL